MMRNEPCPMYETPLTTAEEDVSWVIETYFYKG